MRRSMYHCPFGTDLKFHLSRTGPMLWLLSVHAFIEVPPPGTVSSPLWAFAGGFLEIIAAFASDETPGSRAMLVIGGCCRSSLASCSSPVPGWALPRLHCCSACSPAVTLTTLRMLLRIVWPGLRKRGGFP